MEYLRQLARDIGQAWRQLTLSARVNIVLAGAATVFAIVAMVVLGTRADYVRLYSGLGPEDSAAIESYLRQEGIPYRARAGGQVIEVPADRRSRVRVALMEQDLPRTYGRVPGFELLDQTAMIANEWRQNVMFMRAVQGELQRHLNEFDFVRRSFVFIRESEDRLFVSEQEPSEAAVTLDTLRTLTPLEVRAVLGIVSSFGGGHLTPANITLTTTKGDVLHLPPADEFAALATSRLDYRDQVESRLEKRIMAAMKEIGVQAVVRVSANIDHETRRETSETYTEGAIVSEWTTDVRISTTEAPPEGPPGARQNLPEGMFVPPASQTEETTEEVIMNYDPSRSLVETSREAGEITGYRVAAFVEGDHQPAAAGEDGETEYVGLSEERLTQYRNWIAAAAGIDVEDVVIQDHPFRIERLAVTQVAFREMEAAARQQMILDWARRTLQILALVVAFLAVRRMLRRITATPLESPEEEVELPEASPEDMRRREVASEIERLAEQEPETVANLLRSWIREGES